MPTGIYVRTDVARANISKARLGKKATKETLEKKSLVMSGDKHPNWKGGRQTTAYGYILIYAPKHPFADRCRTVREHRLVVEKQLKRYLTKFEVIHHINGIKNDNRSENLYLFSCEKEHRKFHRLKNTEPLKSNLP